jgi:transcription elongation factor GreA
MEKDYILTPEGKAKLEEELQYLETEKRAEIGERIRVAREFGDISENSEYDDAKNEQAMMEGRIAEITRILGEATVVDAPKRSSRVNIGSKVTVDMGGKERTFTIVGAAEANSAEGKISNESPVGSALLGSKKGDEIDIQGPTGRDIHMSVLKIEQ